MNSYLTPDERKEKEMRKMGQINIFSQAIPRNSSRIRLGLVEPVKDKLKCACN